MSRKIKSITVNLPVDTISFNKLTTTQISKLTDLQIEALTLLAKESGDVEYEQAILKRPDGSLITPPREGEYVYFIRYCFSRKELFPDLDSYHDDYIYSLKEGCVFLDKDIKLAEKKAKMLTKQLEIQYEIDKLNAEQGWVEDWSPTSPSKKLEDHNRAFDFSDHSDEIVSIICLHKNLSRQHMSKNTAEKILKKYSQAELKQYLGIIL
jgi:hypothetical protein